MLTSVRFSQALSENPVPRRLGDVRLHFEGGRLVGESLPPSFWLRLWPTVALLLAGTCALGAVALLVASPSRAAPPLGLAAVASSFVGYALFLEGRLGRRRFVLHFHTETLRVDTLRWAPGATRTLKVPFDAVTAVEVRPQPDGRSSLVVCWRQGPEQPLEQALLVRQVRPGEQEALVRVWRMLHNAFGLRGAGLA